MNKSEILKKILKEKNVNPKFFENPAFNSAISMIIQEVDIKINSIYTLEKINERYDELFKYHLELGLHYDEEGNFSYRNGYNPKYESNICYSFNINKNDELIISTSLKNIIELENNNKKTEYYVGFSYDEDIFDKSGIEIISNKMKTQVHKERKDEVISKVEDDYFPTKTEYDRTNNGLSSKVTYTRNYDLGSMRIEYSGDLIYNYQIPINNYNYVFSVKIKGEYFNRIRILERDRDAINQIFESVAQSKKVSDITKLRDENPNLIFSIANLTDDEKEQYFDDIDRHIKETSSPMREVMQKLALERGMISVSKKLEYIEKGIIDDEGNLISNLDENKFSFKR